MGWQNYDDVLCQLQAYSLLVTVLEVDTPRPVRCKVAGEDAEKRGWYWLHSVDLKDADGQIRQYIAGAFGVYHGNDNGKQKVKINRNGGQSLTPAEKAAIAARHRANMERLKAARQQEARKAAAVAEKAWLAYVPTGDSDYLKRKGVGSYGLRYAPVGNGTLAVPMMRAGQIVGLQIIRGKDRGNKLEKQYWPAGIDKQGAYHLIGGAPAGLILVAEGYATAASLFEATGLPVAVAFDAGSLMPVAQALKKQYPGNRLLICADDDYRTAGNPGQTAASLTATAVGGAWCAPVFAESRPDDRKGPTDFNDLHRLEGLHVVRQQLETAIASAGWKLPQRAGTVAPASAPNETDSPAKAVSVQTVTEVVSRFIWIDDATGDYVFDLLTREVCKRSKVTALLPPGTRWDQVKQHPVWASRAVYLHQIGFDPTGQDSNIVCNTWQGWPTTPQVGNCDTLLDLLRWLCGDDGAEQESLFAWVLKWLAYPIQKPGAKMQTALVVHGPQGSGKSVFFEAVAQIYGPHGIVLNQGALEDKFNSDWCQGKLFVIADEVAARSDVYHLKNQLKALITGDTVRVNPKNLPAHKERNHMNLVFLSNEVMPVVLEDDDRRHCVIWTPPKLADGFYEAVSREIAAGGIAALHDYLLHLDLTGFYPWTKPPATRAKAALIEQCRDSTEQFIREWQQGMVEADPDKGPLPFCPCTGDDLYRAYLLWCKQNGVFGLRQRTQRELIGGMKRLPDWQVSKQWVLVSLNATERKQKRMVIPSDKAMQDAETHNPRLRLRRPEGKALQVWLTECLFEFRNALQLLP